MGLCSKMHSRAYAHKIMSGVPWYYIQHLLLDMCEPVDVRIIGPLSTI